MTVCAILNKAIPLLVIILVSHIFVTTNAGGCKHPCEFSFTEGGTTIDASSKCCSDVPLIQGASAVEISNIKTIHLRYNKLSNISSGTFSDLGGFSNLTKNPNTTLYPEIETISLFKNKIQRFYPGSFDGTENSLRILNLQHNRIEKLELVIPFLPTTLQELYLDENIKIKSIPSMIFELFENMKILSITAVDAKYKPARNLVIEPDAFYGMKKLKSLYLSGMGIPSLPVDIFSDNILVSKIYLHNNRISSLNSQIFKNLGNLTHLIIYGNSLTSYSGINCGGTCLRLHTLDVSGNAITDLPVLVTMFPNLRIFRANKNKINDVEELCFENMTSLVLVDISENPISDMPQLCIICPQNLSSFSFHSNQMTTVKQYVLEGMINYASTIDLRKLKSMTVLQRLSAHPLNAQKVTATEGGIQTVNSTFFMGMTNLKTFSITINELIETPPFGLQCPSLQSINLCKNKIVSIRNDTFLYLPSLRNLSLCENMITYIPEYIELPASLEILDLTWNFLPSLNSTVKNLKFLKTLIVTKNRIESVPFNTLANLTALQHLAMDENSIEYINESDGCCPSLKVLKMNKNYLQSIPLTFLMGVPQLRELSLQENKLISLPEIGNNARHLWSVDISKNDFSSLPINIFKDTKLKTLKMNDNRINALPNLQSVNDTLQCIDGSYNKITTLNGDANVFKQFGKLISVDLSNNEISITPPENLVYGMDRLKALNLSRNKIESFPDKWHEFPMLKEIDFQENRLTSYQNFTPLSNTLVKLNLSVNSLSDMTCNNLTLAVITHLNMSHNDYKSAPNLYAMDLLQSLDLSWNEIESLPYNWSTGFTNTEYLFLQHNMINDIAQGVLLHLHQLKELDLSNNRLTEFVNITELSECINILALDYNQIEYFDLPDDAPAGFRTPVKNLTMSHNNIRSISVSFLQAAEELLMLDLMSNQIINFDNHLLNLIESGNIQASIKLTDNDLQLICGRIICKVLDYLDSIFIVDGTLTPCAYPVRVYGLTWEDMVNPEIGYEAIKCRRK